MLIAFFDVCGIVHAEFLPKAKLLISTSDALSEGEKKRIVGNEVMDASS